MTTSSTDTKHPYYEEISDIDFEERSDFFAGENSFRMKFVSLGEALDFVCGAGMNYTIYQGKVECLIKFIRTWMRNQRPKIEYEQIPDPDVKGLHTIEEKRRQYGYNWNIFSDNFPVLDLPRINHEVCPRNKEHSSTILDTAGRIRCAETISKRLKPSFIEKCIFLDELSGIKKTEVYEDKPQAPPENEYDKDGEILIDWAWEREVYRKEKMAYDEEVAINFEDSCYAVIQEPEDISLPLETILKRLAVSRRYHFLYGKFVVYPFLGFTLANYVQTWYKQPGPKRVWEKPEQHIEFNFFPDFHPINSDD